MKKPVKKAKKTVQKKPLVALLTVAVFLLAAFWIGKNFIEYRNAKNFTQTDSIRQLVLSAVEGTKSLAPVDAKTGDVYFPQAKLYVPVQPTIERLTYSYDPSGEGLSEALHVSSQRIFGVTSSKAVGALTMKELFDQLPSLQACQRGIRVVYTKDQVNDGEKLLQTVALRDGKTLYLFGESDTCPQLVELSQSLKEIKSY